MDIYKPVQLLWYIKTSAPHYRALIGDSYRIQTCNLLIRSQMLYSVELRSLAIISDLRLQNYCFFLNPQNFRAEKFSQFLI